MNRTSPKPSTVSQSERTHVCARIRFCVLYPEWWTSVGGTIGVHQALRMNTAFIQRYRVPKQSNPIDGQVGSRLKLRRMIVGMSQEALGDKVGLTFQQIQKYEKGVNRIGAGRLYELAQVLGVSVGYFYEGGLERIPGSCMPRDTAVKSAREAPVIEFLATQEGLQLSLAYVAIKDAKVRKRVLDLVRSLAAENDELHH